MWEMLSKINLFHSKSLTISRITSSCKTVLRIYKTTIEWMSSWQAMTTEIKILCSWNNWWTQGNYISLYLNLLHQVKGQMYYKQFQLQMLVLAWPWKDSSWKLLVTVLFDNCSMQIILFLSLVFRSHLESYSLWYRNFPIFYQLSNTVRNKTKKSSEKCWGQLSWVTIPVQLIQAVIKNT